MRNRRFSSPAALEAKERRQREDDAPRLKSIAPDLASLRIEFESYRGGGAIAGTRHIKIVVVDSAPALFEVPCGDAKCRDGGHDFTAELVRGLADHAADFSGSNQCYGQLGTGPCDREMRFSAHAEYAKGGTGEDPSGGAG